MFVTTVLTDAKHYLQSVEVMTKRNVSFFRHYIAIRLRNTAALDKLLFSTNFLSFVLFSISLALGTKML